MKKSTNSINRITIINTVSTFILQGIAFISTPIFTRMLGTEQFGVYSLFYSWVLIMTCFMGLSISASIGTGCYNFKESYTKFRSSILVLIVLVCTIELLLIFILRTFISTIIGLNVTTVILIGLTSYGHAIVNFAQTCFIYEKKALSNLVLSLSVSITTVLLSVYLINIFSDSNRYYGRMIGMAIPYCVIALILFIIIYKKSPVGYDNKYWKYGIVVGGPILFHSLSQIILVQSDRVMMQMIGISSSEIGIYSMFYTLTAVLSTILGALNNSWCPFYYDDINNENWILIEKKSKNYIELFTVLCVGFLLLSREVSYLMADSSYWRGINIIPLLSIAVYFTFMYQFPVNFEFFYKKTKLISICTVCTALLNVILNAFLIPKYGMYGAALATAISYFVLFVAHYYSVTHMKNHFYHIRMNTFVLGFIGLFLGIVMFYLLSSYWYIRWILGFLLGCFELLRIYNRNSIF